MKKIRVVASACVLMVGLAASRSSLLLAQQPTKVANKITLKAVGFPLTDVRLLEGPFHDAMLRDQQYLLALDVDRLLHTFRTNAGLPSSAQPYGGWEAPDVELRGHSLGHFLTACALMYATTGDERFKTKAVAVVAELAKVQQALQAKGSNAGYLSAFPEELFDRVDARQRVWAPYYTIHKIMAGLLDVHQLCASRQALDVLLRKADWVKLRVDRLSDEQQQRALETEFGGMNEVLANLYAVTGNPEHLRLARKFDHAAVFDPLARGEDKLDGLHANTQIPKAIGAAREYELTAEPRYRDIASFFWQRVAKHRSYVIGGHSDGERFFPVDQFERHLGASSAETCNTYNMLKLTRHLFSWEPSAETMDFYERGLLNHILASQDPASSGVTYYCPLKPGAFKSFSTPDASFWCCVGTGMENHAKYTDTIYFKDADSLYVNLFVASELRFFEKQLVVRQRTRFPEEDTSRLTFEAARPVRLAVKLRYPGWAQSGMNVSVNGKPERVAGRPGSYVSLQREWKDGDTLEVRLPMTLRLETLPNEPSMVALLYEPVVLAGDLGKEGLDSARRYGPSAPQLGRLKTPEIPAFVGDARGILGKVEPVAGAPLTFRTVAAARPHDVKLVPFYKAFDQRYTVYFKVFSPAEWEKHKAGLALAAARRKDIQSRSFDSVDVSDAKSEDDHGMKGESTNETFFEGRRGRDARAGWFSYALAVPPDTPVSLIGTFRGSEGRRRVFDVLVDGEKIATHTLEYHPAELLDLEFPVPETLTRGKQRITVRFTAHADAATGGLFELRVLPAERERR